MPRALWIEYPRVIYHVVVDRQQIANGASQSASQPEFGRGVNTRDYKHWWEEQRAGKLIFVVCGHSGGNKSGARKFRRHRSLSGSVSEALLERFVECVHETLTTGYEAASII